MRCILNFWKEIPLSTKSWLTKIPSITNGLKKLTKKEKEKIIADRNLNMSIKQLAAELNKLYK